MESIEPRLVKIFKETSYEPSSDLAFNIWYTITLHEKRNTRIKLWIFSLVGFISFAGFIPALNLLLNDLRQSGFYEYFSLIFSNGSVLFFWKELVLSIAESLPTASIILTLSLVFVFVLSLKYLIKQLNNNSLSFIPKILSI